MYYRLTMQPISSQGSSGSSAEQTLYDSRYPNASHNFVAQIEQQRDLGQTDSLTFDIYPTHPCYNSISKMKTFVHGYRDTNEIFYGRVLDIQKGLNGEKTVKCEGAASFLLDSEAPVFNNSETPAAFFTRLINNHNTQVEDEKKFTVGTVTPKNYNVSTAFKVEGHNRTADAYSNLLSGKFNVYLRIRPGSNGTHIIDYIEKYNNVNTQPISIGVNIIDKNDQINGEDLFTVLCPVGKNNLTIKSENGGSDYIRLDGTNGRPDLISEYGTILRIESFSDVNVVATLINKANEFITNYAGKNSFETTITVIDMHILNPSLDVIELGDSFSNIEGADGETLVVASQTICYNDPQQDKITLKNEVALQNQRNGKGGSLSVSQAAGSWGNTHVHHLMREEMDTAIGDKLYLHGDYIFATADQLVDLGASALRFGISGSNFFFYKGHIDAQGKPVYENGHQVLDDITSVVMGYLYDNLYLNANSIYLDADDEITLSSLFTIVNGNLDIDGQATIRNLVTNVSYVYTDAYIGGTIYIGHESDEEGDPGTDVGTAIASLSLSESNGHVYITPTLLNGNTGTAVNFNMAGTQWYLNQVSAFKSAVTNNSVTVGGYYDSTTKKYKYMNAYATITYPGDNSSTQVGLSVPDINLATVVDGYYSDGWGDSYDEIAIDPSSAQSLNPGGSVTVNAKGKATSSGSLTTKASVTVTARSLVLEDLTGSNKITQNGTITPSSGYDGISGIEIDVPSSGNASPNTIDLSRHQQLYGATDPWPSGHSKIDSTPADGLKSAVLDAYNRNINCYLIFDITSGGVNGYKRYYMTFNYRP